MLILWPILWILAMIVLIVATIVAGVREKKTRVKAASQGMQPTLQMGQDGEALAAGGDGFGDDFGATDAGFGDDPFK